MFGNLSAEAGLESLNKFLGDNSYVKGYQLSQEDLNVFKQILKVPNKKFIHLNRWYNHVKSYGQDELKKLGITPLTAGATTTTAAKKDDDEDVDLFGSEDEEDEEAARVREERLKAYAEKKSKKPALIAKSSVLLDVKPWDDTTDMKEMERLVRTIEMDGLVWGVSKLVPVGYGIHKLQIMCVVEDEKVSVDLLQDKIAEFEDFVQSADVAAFSKI